MAWYSSSTPPIVRPFSCVLFIILYCGNGVIADAIFTNLWAVKVRGSQQEAEELAHKYGFSYNKNVSFSSVKASLLSPCSMLPFVRASAFSKWVVTYGDADPHDATDDTSNFSFC